MTNHSASLKTDDIIRNGSFTREAKTLAAQHQEPERFARLLMERALYPDALHFLARWLPGREGIWWACLCLWHIARPGFAESLTPIFQGTVRWVQDPREQHRRELAALAETAEVISEPVVRIGVAASCADPERAANIVLAALLVAATRHNLANPAATQRNFVELGLEVAQGENRWA